MLRPVCAVYDKKVGAYDQPFTTRHVGEAVREWTNIKMMKETRYGKNPEDFDLFQIAEFDDELGTFENKKPHIHLDSGL